MIVKILIIVIVAWLLVVVGFLFYLYSDPNNLKSEESQEALIEMTNLYGNCSLTIAEEKAFEFNLVQAETVEEKENAKNEFIEEINRCKKLSHMAVCAASGCKWNEESN